MIHPAIEFETSYLTQEQLSNSPSRKDGIDEATEETLRVYGCSLVQESGILLRLPQAVMATGQVLFHRFYSKKSFVEYNVKFVAACCIWLASKLEECPRKARQVLIVFHRMVCRRENLPIERLDLYSKKYLDMKVNLTRMEVHVLREMGFFCVIESHPHKFIVSYLAVLETPPELRQEAWNLANDSLRTTLCLRFKSEVVACAVIYAAARRLQVPLPENPPWWEAFGADKSEIDEVCRVLAHLYRLPRSQYIHVCKDESWNLMNQSKDGGPATKVDTCMLPFVSQEVGKNELILGVALRKVKELKTSYDASKGMLSIGESRKEPVGKGISDKKDTETSGERNKERKRDKEKEREKDITKNRVHDSRNLKRKIEPEFDEELKWEDSERDKDKDKDKDRVYCVRGKRKDSGRSKEFKRHSSCSREYHRSSYLSSGRYHSYP